MQTNRHNGLGLVADFQRKLQSGSAYESLIPKAEMQDTVVKRDGNLPDTVALMKRIVHATRSDTARLAEKLKGRDLHDTCQRLWHFVYHHLQYRLDEPGTEQLRRPARSWADRKEGVDCDCYSIFLSSLLLNLGIPHRFRITEYKKEDGWQHVYVIVPIPGSDRYYTLDAVLNRFDYEKPYRRKQDHLMDIAYLSGPGDSPTVLSLTGLGAPPETDPTAALKQYLQDTRSLILQQPQQFQYLVNPQQYVQLLDYALQYWDTPQREQALAILAEQETRIQMLPGLKGLDGYELGGLFKKIGQTLKNVGKGITNTVKKVGEGIKNFVEDPLHALNKINPATVLARNGYLLYLSTIGKKQAAKLKWGYISDEQARAKRLNMDEVKRWRDMIRKVEDIYDKIGGEKSKLRETILHHGGGLGQASIGSLGEPATAATIAAASAVIAAVGKLLSDLKGDKPATDGSPPAAESTELIQALQTGQQLVQQGSQIVKQVMPIVKPTTPAPTQPISYDQDFIPQPAINDETNYPSLVPTTTQTSTNPMSESKLPATSDGSGTPEKSFLDKAKDFVQKNPLLVVGAALGAYLLFTDSGKKTAQHIGEITGLSGPKPKRRRKRKTKQNTQNLGAPKPQTKRKKGRGGKSTSRQRKRIKRAHLR